MEVAKICQNLKKTNHTNKKKKTNTTKKPNQIKPKNPKTKQVSVLEIKVSKHGWYLKVMHLKTDTIEDKSVTAHRFIAL